LITASLTATASTLKAWVRVIAVCGLRVRVRVSAKFIPSTHLYALAYSYNFQT
jgi:hypothetical protein